jgi:hypothetical protein
MRPRFVQPRRVGTSAAHASFHAIGRSTFCHNSANVTASAWAAHRQCLRCGSVRAAFMSRPQRASGGRQRRRSLAALSRRRDRTRRSRRSLLSAASGRRSGPVYRNLSVSAGARRSTWKIVRVCSGDHVGSRANLPDAGCREVTLLRSGAMRAMPRSGCAGVSGYGRRRDPDTSVPLEAQAGPIFWEQCRGGDRPEREWRARRAACRRWVADHRRTRISAPGR